MGGAYFVGRLGRSERRHLIHTILDGERRAIHVLTEWRRATVHWVDNLIRRHLDTCERFQLPLNTSVRNRVGRQPLKVILVCTAPATGSEDTLELLLHDVLNQLTGRLPSKSFQEGFAHAFLDGRGDVLTVMLANPEHLLIL